jgi:hypothetical protein
MMSLLIARRFPWAESERSQDMNLVLDWFESPWKSESYLGLMLDRNAALASPLKDLFLHVAGHIAGDVPEVQAFRGLTVQR